MSELPGRILAIDLGDRRIGLAVSDPMRMIAQPAGFLERRAGKRPPLTALLAKALEVGATAFVVGLPLDEAGEDTPRAVEARRLAHELESRTGHPARLLDERFTTSAALRAVKEMEGSTRGRRGDVDALAATVLLEQALAAGGRLFESTAATGSEGQRTAVGDEDGDA
ncbi:MAG: Holliday junction resolvase RuvX [Gemmatimonadaceae bacterium]|nr:Holliday junction resolvase RuvX [Gemmatimonadaceae bacterium]